LKQVIAGCLSEEEIMGLKQMFKSIDTDNSGSITFEELKQGLQQQGTKLSEYEVKQLMEAVSNTSILYSHLYNSMKDHIDSDHSQYVLPPPPQKKTHQQNRKMKRKRERKKKKR